ncbi:MAG: extracellular solute-binding protein [Clostridia bacterium]|nr:extracellular solute-binding protein [Clostridia bacterium]
MKKTIAIILLLAMLSFCLVACDDGSVSDESSADKSDSISVNEPIKTEIKDLNGREINVLCHDFAVGLQYLFGYSGEIMYAEENPSAVDEAKKRVVDYIESNYNCVINGDLTSSAGGGTSVVDKVKNQVTSGLHEYDIVFDTLGNAPTLATGKYIIDLNKVPNLNLSDPWWDQNAVKDLSIDGKNYFVNGDINTYDDQGTWVVMFNKTLKTKLGIEEDFYQLVRDNQWTYDKFVEICKRDITSDSSGDGTLDDLDTWAFGTECYNIYIQLAGAGLKIAEKDENDIPYLTVDETPEETYTILGKVLEFYNDDQTVMVAENYKYKNYPNVYEGTVHKAFLEGRELFYMCGLMNGPSFRMMEDEFGILPIPKYYDTQDRYYHTISSYNSTVLMIPEGAPDLADLGLVISAIAEQSKRLVTPAYYDIQLKYRDSRDDESGEMLDLIFASRTFDLGCYYNWAGIRSHYMSLSSADIVSRFDAIIVPAIVEMEQFVDSITAKE